MPASGLAASANRTTGARSPCTGSTRRPRPATTTKVRKGAIHRATAPATENITSGKVVPPNLERQSGTADDGAHGRLAPVAASGARLPRANRRPFDEVVHPFALRHA